MAKMKPPKVPEQPVPVLRLEAVARLIATAERTKHVENFGMWRDAEGRLLWGINDFDEACCVSYV